MTSKLRKAWAMSASDWALLGRAWTLLLVIDAGLRLLPYKTLEMRLQQVRPRSTAQPVDEAGRIRHITLMLDRARRLHLIPMTCLRRSLALQRLLAAEGIDATLRFGVRRAASITAAPAPGQLQAHAWLERDGRPISEPEALVGRYTSLARNCPEQG